MSSPTGVGVSSDGSLIVSPGVTLAANSLAPPTIPVAIAAVVRERNAGIHLPWKRLSRHSSPASARAATGNLRRQTGQRWADANAAGRLAVDHCIDIKRKEAARGQ